MCQEQPVFKGGDRVRVTALADETHREVGIGEIGIISECYGPYSALKTEDGRGATYWNYNLESVDMENRPFKVGDSVRLLQASHDRDGELAEITVIAGNFCSLKFDKDEEVEGGFSLTNLEHTNEPKKVSDESEAHPAAFDVGDTVLIHDKEPSLSIWVQSMDETLNRIGVVEKRKYATKAAGFQYLITFGNRGTFWYYEASLTEPPEVSEPEPGLDKPWDEVKIENEVEDLPSEFHSEPPSFDLPLESTEEQVERVSSCLYDLCVAVDAVNTYLPSTEVEIIIRPKRK